MPKHGAFVCEKSQIIVSWTLIPQEMRATATECLLSFSVSCATNFPRFSCKHLSALGCTGGWPSLTTCNPQACIPAITYVEETFHLVACKPRNLQIHCKQYTFKVRAMVEVVQKAVAKATQGLQNAALAYVSTSTAHKACLSIYLSIYIYIYISLSLSVYLALSLSLALSPSLSLSVSLSLSRFLSLSLSHNHNDMGFPKNRESLLGSLGGPYNQDCFTC